MMETEVKNETAVVATKNDYKLSLIAGILIGVLLLPILKTANQHLYDVLYLAIVPFFAVATPLGLRISFYISKKIAIFWQIAKFGLIGVLNTLVDIGFLAFLQAFFIKYFQIRPEKVLYSSNVNIKEAFLVITIYSLYKASSFIVANINSYFWNKYWTFEKKQEDKSRAEFMQFFVVSVIGFTINVVVASYVFGSFGDLAGLSKDQWGLIGAAIGSVAGLAWNFIGYKFWVFKK